MKKNNSFSKGVIYTLSTIFLLTVILAVIGVVAYNGYKDAALEAGYAKDGVETKIKIEKNNSELKSVQNTENLNKISNLKTVYIDDRKFTS